MVPRYRTTLIHFFCLTAAVPIHFYYIEKIMKVILQEFLFTIPSSPDEGLPSPSSLISLFSFRWQVVGLGEMKFPSPLLVGFFVQEIKSNNSGARLGARCRAKAVSNENESMNFFARARNSKRPLFFNPNPCHS